TAYADATAVKQEIEVQEMILAGETDNATRARIGLQLARLLGPCGRHARVVELLAPLLDDSGTLRCELQLELGHSLCRLHRSSPASAEFRRGQDLLREVATHCTETDFTAVPDLRKRRSIHARALSRLALSWESVRHREAEAVRTYGEALNLEPDNPYHLASLVGYSLHLNKAAPLDSLQPSLERALDTCREQAKAGTELPFAFFTAGRLALLLGRVKSTLGRDPDAQHWNNQALGWYALGLRHQAVGDSCFTDEVIDDELNWIRQTYSGDPIPPQGHLLVERLIELSRSFASSPAPAGTGSRPTTGPGVLIVAGCAASLSLAERDEKIFPLLEAALAEFEGQVISGGTTAGVPGCVGEITAKLRSTGARRFELVGYIPASLPELATKDTRYDRHVAAPGDINFTAGQILKTWEDLLATGIVPANVQLLGFGGDPLTTVEYRVALALGATVGVVLGTCGSADAILEDPLWKGFHTLLALPPDKTSLRAFVAKAPASFSPETLETMGRQFHARYVATSPGKLPDNMRPWDGGKDGLSDTFKKANIEQARHAVAILQACNFEVRAVTPGVQSLSAPSFTPEELEILSELEHGRWNIERLRSGWRPGTKRDDTAKIHDCLVAWDKLPESIKDYDRDAVKAFPEILANAGFEIVRKGEGRHPETPK
ncbi:MAG: hypothetical protein LUQ59_12025, partial [Methanothrix sp.]|nr:hypothetical protein [Methanothrix sp.]